MNTCNKKIILIIFLVSFGIRLFFAYLGFNYPDPQALGSDSIRFDTAALNLSLGRGFVVNGIPAIDRVPVYVLFLASIYFIFGHSYLAVIFFQSIISALTCIVVFGISKKIFNPDIAVFSSILCAIFIPLIGINNSIMSEPIYTLLSCVMIYYFLQYIENPCFKNSLIAGLSFGIGILSRPVFVFLFIFTTFFIFAYSRRSKVKKYVLSVLIFLFTGIFIVFPWFIRNYMVTKRFIPVTIYGGYNFYAATLLDKPVFELEHEQAYDPTDGAWNENISDWQYTKLAYSNIKGYPLRYIKASLKRLLNLAFHSYAGALGLEKIEKGQQSRYFFTKGIITWPLLIRGVLILSYIVIYMYALLGIFSNKFVINKDAKHYVIYFLFIYLFLIAFASFGASRFYSPAYPLLIIFSSQGIHRHACKDAN